MSRDEISAAPFSKLILGRDSTHPLARTVRFSLILFGLQVLASRRLEISLEMRFRDSIYTAALSWFAVRPL